MGPATAWVACLGKGETSQPEAHLRTSTAEVNLSASEPFATIRFAFSRITVNRDGIHFDNYRGAIPFADAVGSTTTYCL